MRPSSTVAVTRRLSKLTEEHDLPVPLSASKTLDRGAINLEGGASAPLAPPLNPPLPKPARYLLFDSLGALVGHSQAQRCLQINSKPLHQVVMEFLKFSYLTDFSAD